MNLNLTLQQRQQMSQAQIQSLEILGGLAGKGRDADTRPQLAQRFV